MENIEFICPICPRACKITINKEIISGYSCGRGLQYAKNILTNSKNFVYAKIKVINGKLNFLSVKSSKEVEICMDKEIRNYLEAITVTAPIKMNQIIVNNIIDSDINIIAQRKIDAKS